MAVSEPKLSISWHDSSWIPVLNKDNVMDYFSQKSNPFYDRTCNNEIIKMQRADPAQLVNMTGIEYSLYLTQDPILYVIRKVHRHSQDKVIPLADYYVLGGVVYQCPDLQSVINSRLLSTLHLVHQAFDEALSYARYEPSRGYYWKFPGDEGEERKTDNVSKPKDEPTETQRKRVDGLLMELVKNFPPKVIQPKEGTKPIGVGGASVRGDVKDVSVAKQPGIPPTSTSTTDIKLPEPKRKKPTQI